jgi:hypothetical protein
MTTMPLNTTYQHLRQTTLSKAASIACTMLHSVSVKAADNAVNNVFAENVTPNLTTTLEAVWVAKLV